MTTTGTGTEIGQVRYIRLFAVFFLALCTYVIWVPFESSLVKTTAVVASAEKRGVWGKVYFTLSDGQVAKCEGKTWRKGCPYDELSRLKGNGTLVVWHKDGKIWQIETAEGRKMVDLSTTRFNNMLILAFIYFIFGGMAIFAPSLIKPRQRLTADLPPQRGDHVIRKW